MVKGLVLCEHTSMVLLNVKYAGNGVSHVVL